MSRKGQNPKEHDDDEAQLLATLDASLQEQSVYESTVLQEATHQLAPRLVLAAEASNHAPGFPSLQALAPGHSQQRQGQNSQHSMAWSDVMAVESVLRRTQKRILTSTPTDMDCLKEQMLLQFLVNTSREYSSNLPSRSIQQEQALEDRRRQALKQQQEDSVSRQQKTSATVQTKAVRAPRIRVPIMKRKRQKQQHDDDDGAPDDVTAEYKAQLKRMRLERKRKSAQRRRRFVDGGSESSENEFEDSKMPAEEKKEVMEETESVQEFAPENESVASASAVVQKEEEPATTTVVCPLCQAPVEILDATRVDETLAVHMNVCQNPRGRSTRARRSTAAIAPVLDDPEALVTGRKTRVLSVTAKKKGSSKKKKTVLLEPAALTTNAKDDLEEWVYDERVDRWIEEGVSQMKDMKERDETDVPGALEYDGGLYVPAWIYNRLFGYQREGIKWLWNLHRQQAGGIVGDEMGLGKTVQVSAFLGSMASSRKLRSVLVVAPATMLQHWLKELAVWAPGLRRILIHPSGEVDGHPRTISAQRIRSLDKWLREARRDRVNEAIDDDDWDTLEPHSFCGTGFVVVTTYENLRRNADVYTAYEWSYMVCDESQKLKNPDADITLACKRIRTPHRLAISGTPIQNDLTELWSIFDFSNAGLLGTLPAFQQEFADPIRRGGYSNASPVQVQLAYRCALILRDLIKPYLLRRQKKDIKEVSRMPGKTEHVLFCRLSDRQRAMYEAYLRSDEVSRVVRGSTQLFAAITMIRKICNHPDLCCDPGQAALESFVKNAGLVNTALGEAESSDDEVDSADESLVERSGKLEILSKILPLWKKQGHKVLIFCQWRKMLSIIQRFTMMKGWKCGRLDGNTSIASRQQLVDNFNNDDSYFCMLCTTRTGGVGLNLTGANRIILYDPDFNPSVDAQARERAWRFGQEREVTIYRLITAGTVEEKIYQRQIFKTALSNKVLQDPRQRRLFSQRDLKDLFTLRADNGSVIAGGDGMTETGRVTKGVGVLDVDEDIPKEDEADDNNATLKKVMQSKGLAGIFDHHYLEKDPFQKTVTTSEMEEQAKRVAREALSALRKSTESQDRFAPTWTGSEKTDPRRFGPAKANGSTVSSNELLSSLRKRQADTGGGSAPIDGDTGQYAKLLSRVKDYVRRWKPATDEILEEFKDVKDCDVAVFRRLLKSVAVVRKGKWNLLESS